MHLLINKYIVNLLAMILSLISLFVVLEVSIRFAGFEPRKFPRTTTIESNAKKGGYIWRGTEVQEYEIPIIFNQYAFREREFECVNKPDNIFRIIVLGDSYTEAKQVFQEKTFHKVVERRLNEEYGSAELRYEVLNFAKSGFSTLNIENVLRHKAIRCKPDLVLEEFNSMNDLADNSPVLMKLRAKQYKKFRKRKYSREQMNNILILFDGSMLNHFVAEAISDIYTDCPIFCNYLPADYLFFTDSTDKTLDEAWKITKTSILNQNKMIKARLPDTKFAFWMKDTLLQYMDWKTKLKYNYDDYNWDIDKPARLMGSFLSEHGLPYVDVSPSIEAYRSVHGYNSVCFKYDSHWNDKGHEIAADVIFDFLVREKLISK